MMDLKSNYRRECLLKASEWDPIFSILQSDLTLKKIAVSINVDQNVIQNPFHALKLKNLHKLIENLSVHVTHNQQLIELQLVGLPIEDCDIQQLVYGLKNSISLQYLSFAKCKIGDTGAKHVVEAVKNKPNIVWIDMRNCSLTSESSETLYSLIHFQSEARENAVWKASLRDEVPNLNLMGGLRRLTLSGNNLGNAVNSVALALQEDRWIKALDLQSCNMDDSHLKEFLKAAMKNQSLVFLDIKSNNFLNSELSKRLLDAVKSNSLKHSSFYFEPIDAPKTSLKHSSSSSYLTKCADKVNERKPKKNFLTAKIKPKQSLPENKITNTDSRKTLAEAKGKTTTQMRPYKPLFKAKRDNISEENNLQSKVQIHFKELYGEMETAWARIAKLECEVGQLRKKDQDRSFNSMLSNSHSSDVRKNQNVTDVVLTQSFEKCLRRLLEVLRELKFYSAVDVRESKNSCLEIQRALDVLYAAVHEIVRKVNSPESETLIKENFNRFELHNSQDLHDGSNNSKNRFLPLAKRNSVEEFHFSERNTPTTHLSQINQAHSSKNYPYGQSSRLLDESAPTLENRLVQSFHDQENQLDRLKLNTQEIKSRAEERLTISSTNFKPIMESQFVPNVISLKYSSSSSKTDFKPKREEVLLSSNQESLSKKLGHSENTCTNSLKSLKSNLEELLQQFEKNNDDEQSSLLAVENLDSQTTIQENLQDLSAANQQGADLNYSSDDFNSLSNSVQLPLKSVKSNDPSNFCNYNREEIHKLAINDSYQENQNSCTSSLNLSSIVDLLGNFSVEDIGSSTVTPP